MYKEIHNVSIKNIFKIKYENHLLNWREFQAKKIILKSMPSRAFIELTQNCNFKCIMCRHSQLEQFKEYHPEYDMPLKLFIRIMNTLSPYLTFVDFRGYGETTILPYWPEIVEYISRFPMIQWHLNTNLSMTREDVWDLMIKNNFLIAFSCDGATQKTFEFIRQGSNFNQIKKNLRVVTKAIQKHRRGGIYFLVTVQRHNLMELPAIIKMAKEYHVGSVALRIVREPPSSFVFLPNQPSEVIRAVIVNTIKLAKKYRINVDINDNELAQYISPQLKQEYYPNPTWFVKEIFPYEPSKHHFEAVCIHKRCYKPFGYVYIYSDGKIGPCNHLAFPPIALGDLKKNSFKEIWNGEPFQKFRMDLLNGTPKLPDCQWCFAHRITD